MCSHSETVVGLKRLAKRKRLAKGKRARAQFFTPEPVAEFIWRLVARCVEGDLKYSRVIDPAAGEGVFLDVGLRAGLIQSTSAFGIEVDATLTPAGSAAQARMFSGDALLSGFPDVSDGTFDVVIGNPPFGRANAVFPKEVVRSLAQPSGCPFALWRTASSNAEAEQLFLERALQLVRPGGIIAFVMPDGFLANERAQAARDWVLNRADLVVVVSLPAASFRTNGLNASTSAIILRRHPAAYDGRHTHTLMGMPGLRQSQLSADLDHLCDMVLPNMTGRRHKSIGRQRVRVPCQDLRGSRWDVPYWSLRVAASRTGRKWQMAQLGEFVDHITYGPIVTGRKPPQVAGGVPVILQGDFTETGLKAPGLHVEEGSDWDPLRSRVMEGDLLLPRSGSGSLGRNRLAVYLNSSPANVGCFVDLVRLSGVNPFFVWFFFRSTPGWRQIRSVLNGVGTPNISFSEIRALQLPVIPDEEQSRLQSSYMERVLPLHRHSEHSAEAGEQALVRFNAVVAGLERLLGFVTT